MRVAILGGPGFNAQSVRKNGLVFGWEAQGGDGGFVKADWVFPALWDLDGDGYRDRLARFRLSKADFQALLRREAVQVEVQGVYQDGIFSRWFVARGRVSDSQNTPSSNCTDVPNEDTELVGELCIWTSAANSSFKPIDVATLVADLNDALAPSNVEIAYDSAVVIEAYGGAGHRGHNGQTSFCTAKGGSGGMAGYARTILTVADLPSNLWIYPGNDGGRVATGRAGPEPSFRPLTWLIFLIPN